MRVNTIKLYNMIRSKLSNAGVFSPAFESFMIINYVFKKNYIDLKDDDVTEEKINTINLILQKRAEKYPLQYIVKNWSFFGLEFNIGEGVLIPRSDTEVLVEVGLNLIKEKTNPVIVDLCSGSGCVAISLSNEVPNAKVYAIEKSEEAYKYLEQNVKSNKTFNVKPILADLNTVVNDFKDLSIDLIISNPPYIKTSDIPNLQKEVKFEPAMALDGGIDGLDFYKIITKLWKKKLKPSGLVVFEVGVNQSQDVLNIMSLMNFCNLECWKDLNGINRVISGKNKL